MSNPNDIFANYPRYEQTKATDASAIIAGITQAYTKQKEAFKDISKVNDDFWKNAQTAHQQGWLDKINAMHADDFNNPKTKEQVIQELTRAGREIGGYNNITSMNGVFDTAKTNAIANANTQNEYNENVIDNFAEGILPTVFNLDEKSSQEQVQESKSALDSFAKKYQDSGNAFGVNYINKLVEDFRKGADKERISIFNDQKKLNQLVYEKKVAPEINPHLQLLGEAMSMLEVGNIKGNADMVKNAKDVINHIQAMYAVKGDTDATGKEITEDGSMMKWMKENHPDLVYIFNTEKDKIIRKHQDEHLKRLTNAQQFEVSIQNVMLAKAAQKLREEQFKFDKNFKVTELDQKERHFNSGLEYDYFKTESENSNKNLKLSDSAKASEKELAKNYGITDVLVQSQTGELILNKDSINEALQNVINKSFITSEMRDRLVKAEKDFIKVKANGSSSDEKILNVRVFAENSGEYIGLGDTKLPDDLADYIYMRMLENGLEGNWKTKLHNGNLKRFYNEYIDLVQKDKFNKVQDILGRVSNIVSLPVHEVAFALSQNSDSDYGDFFKQYLTSEQYDKFKAINEGKYFPESNSNSSPELTSNPFAGGISSGKKPVQNHKVLNIPK